MAKKNKTKHSKLPQSSSKNFQLPPAVKGLLVFFLILAVLGLGLFLNQPEERKVFEKDAIKTVKDNQKTYFLVPQANINAYYFDVCEIQMQSPGAYDTARLFFISSYNKQYEINFSYDLDTGAARKTTFRLISLRKHPAWNGMIKEVLLMPDDLQSRVKSISFVAGNPWTRFRAGWEDFTIYRDPLLGTCFTMASPIFWGNYFNSFWGPILWGLLVLAFLASLIFRGKKYSRWAALTFFGAAFLVWTVLDVRNNMVYLKSIQRNINSYWGQTLEQKRGIVLNSPDFVKFMGFCDREVPLKAKMDFHIARDIPGTPNNYLSSTQAEYIFRPRSGTGKLFVLVYGTDFRQDPKLAGLKIYRQFGPQAYILTE